MLAVVFAWTYAIGIFALTSEVQTGWLQVVGFILAGWMTLAGAIAGWQRFNA